MGYRGKLAERERARELRAQAWTPPHIAAELGVSKSSVSRWVRDVEFTPNPRRHNHWTRDNPHPLQVAKEREIECCRADGFARIGRLSDREFLVLGLALDAGEESKTEGSGSPTATPVSSSRSWRGFVGSSTSMRGSCDFGSTARGPRP